MAEGASALAVVRGLFGGALAVGRGPPILLHTWGERDSTSDGREREACGSAVDGSGELDPEEPRSSTEALAEAPLHLSSPPSDGFLASRLTTLVFTSPVPANPSLEMILAVIESFKFVPGLAECPLLVTCDGPGRISKEVRPKRGLLTAEMCGRYEAFVARLQLALGSGRVLVLPEREGFGRAVRAALERVTTPYVLICQHDNIFVRPIDLRNVVRIMEANPERLKCVHFVSPKATFDNAGDHADLRSIEDRLGRVAGGATKFTVGAAAAAEAEEAGGVGQEEACRKINEDETMLFWPMPSWLERNHVCATAHYRDLVFGAETRLKPGQFIEETFGQQMRRDLAKGGSHAKYGVYRLLDSPNSATVHLDGRAYLSLQARRQRGRTAPTLYARLQRQHWEWFAGLSSCAEFSVGVAALTT